MKLALCDADKGRIDCLHRCVQVAMAEQALPYTVRQYAHVVELLCDIEEGVGYDAVFLDASLLISEGDAFFQTVRQKGYTAPIVLTSSKTSSAVDGYEWGVDGFLLYPYDAYRVKRVLSRLFCDVSQRVLTVHRHRTVTRIPFEDIVFIESCNTRCIIHCRHSTEYTVYAHLNDIEARLTDSRFLRCHQSYLVNMDYIVRADSAFEVQGGALVSIRQRDLRRMREQYLMYLESKEPKRIVNRV